MNSVVQRIRAAIRRPRRRPLTVTLGGGIQMAAAQLPVDDKAFLTATDSNGNVVANAGATVTSSDTAVATIAESQGWWVIAQSVGTTTISFTSAAGAVGTLDVDVVPEILTLTLGTPSPK